jgi:hypothetical protein
MSARDDRPVVQPAVGPEAAIRVYKSLLRLFARSVESQVGDAGERRRS